MRLTFYRFFLVLLFLTCAADLCAQVIISEFLASNRSGLQDEDGDSSDWIELEVVASEDVDLSSWFLTDDVLDLTKWQIPVSPDYVLAPGERLLVFASGKNRAGDELHASFSLDSAGEYLALVGPDGTTVVSDFGPRFPRQRPDISYGVWREVETLVDDQTPLEFTIPTDDSLGREWIDSSFVAAGWSPARMGIGYERNAVAEVPEDLVGYWSFDGHLDDLARGNHGTMRGAVSPRFVAGFDGEANAAVELDGGDDYVEVSQQSGLPIYGHAEFSIALWVKGDRQADRRVFSEGSSTSNTPVFNIGTDSSSQSGSVDLFVRSPSGSAAHPHTLSTREAFDGEWHHVAWIDREGEAELWIDGERDGTNFDYARPSMSLDRTSIGAILRASSSFHFEGAIDEVSVWSVALSEEQIVALASGAKALAVGSGRYRALIAEDVESQMYGQGSSVYLRVPFVVEDSERVENLELWARYDDGFVAYLNGVEVVSPNSPANPDANSQALAKRETTDVLAEERFDLPLGTVRTGENLLAMHALNSDSADDEFLLSARLDAVLGGVGQARYFSSPSPGEANSGGLLDFVADTKFSVDRGFFEAAFDLEITCETEGAEIRWTTDGSEPTATTGDLYAGPLRIDATTVLRARAFLEGHVPSNADTQTYIFGEDVLTQTRLAGYPTSWAGRAADYDMDSEIAQSPLYSQDVLDGFLALPSVSLVMNVDDLFGA
ncbi:MAG: LamG-like jellyroll fold domain-containing protein, partial [Planctomycetota bacterium]